MLRLVLEGPQPCRWRVCTWRHGGHIVVPKRWNGGHLGLPNQSVRVQLFSYVITFFCYNKFAWLLDTWVHALWSLALRFCRRYVTKMFLSLFPEAEVSNSCVLNDKGQKSKQKQQRTLVKVMTVPPVVVNRCNLHFLSDSRGLLSSSHVRSRGSIMCKPACLVC